MMNIKHLFAFLLFLGLITVTQQLSAQELLFYGSSDDTDELVIYNATTGNTTTVGSFGTSSVESMKFNPDYITLYAFDHDQLGTINLETGEFTALPNVVESVLKLIIGNKCTNGVNSMDFEYTKFFLYNLDKDDEKYNFTASKTNRDNSDDKVYNK